MFVDKLAFYGIICDGVYREVAALQVLGKIFAEPHVIGVPCVRVFSLDAIGRHLDDLEPWIFRSCNDPDGAVFIFIKSLFK